MTSSCNYSFFWFPSQLVVGDIQALSYELHLGVRCIPQVMVIISSFLVGRFIYSWSAFVGSLLVTQDTNVQQIGWLYLMMVVPSAHQIEV